MEIRVDLDEIERLGITPNQYCLARTIYDKDEKAFKIIKDSYKKDLVFKEDIFTLVNRNYIYQKNIDPFKIVFSETSIQGIFDHELSEENAITENQEDRSWDDFVSEFRNLFPSGVTSGGLYVRSSTKDCSKKLKRFIEEYPEFDEETILEATKKYVARYRLTGYKFMKNANYFIMKDKISVLAAECEMIKDDSGENRSSGNLLNSGI